MVPQTHRHRWSQPSWMRAQTEQAIRGTKGNKPRVQAITSYHRGGNPICGLVRWLWEFGGVDYFNYLLKGCNCRRTGDDVYSCSHVLTTFYLGASLLNIYLCTSPSSINIQIPHPLPPTTSTTQPTRMSLGISVNIVWIYQTTIS